jgi:hypothetical protein
MMDAEGAKERKAAFDKKDQKEIVPALLVDP